MPSAASPERVREVLAQRLAKIEAYRQVVGSPGWRTVYLDLMRFATPPGLPDARSAGRYDVVARIMLAAEGQADIPEVITEKTDG